MSRMEYKYPLELQPDGEVATWEIAVQLEEGGPVSYEPVKASYRQGERAVVETNQRMLRLDPGLKVQCRSLLYQPRPGRTYQPRDHE